MQFVYFKSAVHEFIVVELGEKKTEVFNSWWQNSQRCAPYFALVHQRAGLDLPRAGPSLAQCYLQLEKRESPHPLSCRKPQLLCPFLLPLLQELLVCLSLHLTNPVQPFTVLCFPSPSWGRHHLQGVSAFSYTVVYEVLSQCHTSLYHCWMNFFLTAHDIKFPISECLPLVFSLPTFLICRVLIGSGKSALLTY